MTVEGFKEYVVKCVLRIRNGADLDNAEFLAVCRAIGSMDPDALLAIVELDLSNVQDEQVAEACIKLGVDEHTAVTILRAIDNTRSNGRDELAEHGQDAEKLVRFHLELIEETRVHGRSRGY